MICVFCLYYFVSHKLLKSENLDFHVILHYPPHCDLRGKQCTSIWPNVLLMAAAGHAEWLLPLHLLQQGGTSGGSRRGCRAAVVAMGPLCPVSPRQLTALPSPSCSQAVPTPRLGPSCHSLQPLLWGSHGEEVDRPQSLPLGAPPGAHHPGGHHDGAGPSCLQVGEQCGWAQRAEQRGDLRQSWGWGGTMLQVACKSPGQAGDPPLLS